MTMEAIEKIGNEAQKRNEAEFKKNKKNINFSLRGRNKYYYAYQCALFTKNVKIFGFGHITADMIIKDGICFNQYCRDMKRFNSKEELLGFVIGYNEAIINEKALIKGYNYYDYEAKN